MKVLLFSDQHVYEHSKSMDKLEECLKCLDWIYQTALENSIKNVIFLGDLFHSRNRINIYAYHKVYDILKKYKNDIFSYYLIGNHDMFYDSSWEINSVKPLEEVIGKVIDNPETVNVDGYNIDFMPFSKSAIESMKEHFPPNKRSDILLGHLAVEGAVLNYLYGIVDNSSFDEEEFYEKYGYEKIDLISNKIFDGYKKVFLGHYHTRQKIKGTNIEYIGSPMQISYGEAMSEKGCTILDLETLKTEFIENKISPKYYILPLEQIKDYDITNNYVRLVAHDISQIDVLKIKEDIEKVYSTKEVEIVLSSEYKFEKIILKEETKILDNIESLNKHEILKQYIENSIIDDKLDKEKLLNIGFELIEQS